MKGKSPVRSVHPAAPWFRISAGSGPSRHEVEIVIVIVIEPHGRVESAGGQVRFLTDEFSARVAIQLRTGGRQNAEVHQPVVVEVAGRNGDRTRDAFKAGRGRELLPAQIELDAARRPHQQISLADAGGIDQRQASRGRVDGSLKPCLRILGDLQRIALRDAPPADRRPPRSRTTPHLRG